MKKIHKRIELVCSTNNWLSSMSHVSRQTIVKTLSKHYFMVGITIVNTAEDMDQLLRVKPDLVFIGMKHAPDSVSGETVWLTDFCDEHDIPYTGSAQPAHRLELYKPYAKKIMTEHNIHTAPYYVIPFEGGLTQENELLFPLFLKPANRGGGVGIDSDSVVYTKAALRAKTKTLQDTYQTDVLVEKYLDGREFSVALLKKRSKPTYEVMPVELIAPKDRNGSRLLSGSVKQADAETVLSVIDPILRLRLTKLALAAFHALGARDYGRIDIRLDSHGVPHFLEANLLPSLIENYGSFPKACVINRQLSYEHMILAIVELGLSRSTSQERVIEDSVISL